MTKKGANGKNNYSPEFKESATEAALRLGIRPTARDLGISSGTLSNWVRKYRQDTNNTQKSIPERIPTHDGNPLEKLRGKLERIADLSAERIGEFLEGENPKGAMDGKSRVYTLRDVATVLGISTDKLVLLGGGKLDTAPRAFDVNIQIKTDKPQPKDDSDDGAES